jgi:glycosyltransferase involved in cell wall biosynthesis
MTVQSPSAPVSVVVPTFNHARFVTEAVESVLRQTRPPAEVLVVDDGSTDDTADRLARFGSRIRYLRQANAGVSAARNHGVREATKEYVAFLDSDDVWHPEKLERQMAILERAPNVGLVGTGTFDWPAAAFQVVDGSSELRRVTWEDLVVRNQLTTSSVVVRTDVLRRAGPFDTAIQGPEDRDVWLRVAALAPVANLPAALVGYRAVAGSVSRHAIRCQAGMLRILAKVDAAGGWHGRRWLRRKAYSYAYHSCSYIHGAAGNYRTAVGNVVRSFLWYPLPYPKGLTEVPLERPRRLAVHLLRLARLKAPDVPPEESFPVDCPNALGAAPALLPAGV